MNIKPIIGIAALLVLSGCAIPGQDVSTPIVNNAPSENKTPTKIPKVTPEPSTLPTEDNSQPSNETTLNLSSSNLTKVPSDIFEKTDLIELNLSNNNLTGALPGEIRFLKNLQVLNLSGNNFTGVPAEVGQLSNLRVLNLSNNSLTGLPYELGNLKNLQTLNLSGNDYAEQDLEIIKQGLPENVTIVK